MRRRVLITGLGAVTAAGLGVERLWQAARDGQSGLRPIEFPRNEPQRIKIAAHLPSFDPSVTLGAKLANSIDRFAAFALVAADEWGMQVSDAVSSSDPALVAAQPSKRGSSRFSRRRSGSIR